MGARHAPQLQWSKHDCQLNSRILLGCAKEVAHTRRAHADEHLDKLGAGDGDEGDPRLAGHGSCQQGLAGTCRVQKGDKGGVQMCGVVSMHDCKKKGCSAVTITTSEQGASIEDGTTIAKMDQRDGGSCADATLHRHTITRHTVTQLHGAPSHNYTAHRHTITRCSGGLTRGTLKDDAARDGGAQLSVLCGVLEEVHDLLQLQLGLVAPRNVAKLGARVGLQLDLALRSVERRGRRREWRGREGTRMCQ
jgi:hypothetical protein